MDYGFGIDIGGTTIKFGFFSEEGELCKKWSIPTNIADSGSHILPEIASSIKSFIASNGLTGSDLIGAGIGVPGPVSGDGVVHKCINLGWDVFNVRQELEKLLGLPVLAANDANAAALGEMWKGGGEGFGSLVMVTLGTGIGGGIVVEGKALSGAHGAGGEIGHIPIRHSETRKCSCGKVNCLENYCSGIALARTAKMRILEFGGDSSLLQVPDVSAKEIFDHAAKGDALAVSIVEEFGGILGEALAGVAVVCDPQVFVIGGGVSHAGQPLLDVLQKNFRKYAFHACADTEFVLARLGGDAGAYGAMRLLL